MGTLIENEKLKIHFDVDTEKIQQNDIEIYERGLGKYLTESEYGKDSQAAVMSAIVFGAIDAGFIPEDVLSKEQVLVSKPAKISFLASRISKIIDDVKNEEVDITLGLSEITQFDLEKYEATRKKYTDSIENITIYEIAKANAVMVQIGVAIGWVSEDIVTANSIPVARPALIKHVANEMTSALSEARTISGE